MRKRLALLVSVAVMASGPVFAADGRLEGKLANGAAWAIDTPEKWNGTLVLFSHGYNMGPANPATSAPSAAVREALLARGYALAGSSYRTTGWALEDAVPDQVATLDAFEKAVGKPKRTLAWGSSMGGLVTVALAERYPNRIDGALPMCGSVSGSIGMMNMALDGAFAIKTLLAPDLKFVGVTDDRAVLARSAEVVADAMKTPQGRARLALAATLGQLPPWSDPRAPEPATGDVDEQLRQQATTASRGLFFPRQDQEQRAGGVFSWNTSVNYVRQLDASGRRAYVERFYKAAGLDLDRDLQALNAAPRIAADPKAVAYIRANYVPTGAIADPMLTLHTTDDPLTMVTKESALRDTVAAAGRGGLLRQVYAHRSGHCAFTAAEQVAALQALDDRVATGRWGDLSPEAMNTRAARLALPPEKAGERGPPIAGVSAFAAFTPAAFLRPCVGGKPCAGEPVYDGYVRTSRYVPGWDGTKIAVDLYRPTVGGVATADRLPVAVMNGSGDRRTGERFVKSGDLVRSGYVVMITERRGNGASFGASKGFVTGDDRKDVAAMIGWAAKQPWSTGKVGMIGGSNWGLIQYATAREAPPALKSIAPAVATPNFFYQMYPNGYSNLPGGGFPRPGDAGRAAGPATPVDDDADRAQLAAAQVEHRANLAILDEYPANRFRDSFNPLIGYAPGLEDSPLEHGERINRSGVKVMNLAGWHDPSVGGQLEAFRRFGGRILIGPWNHGETISNPMSDLANRRWLDLTLKGVDDGLSHENPVRYFTINAPPQTAWRSAKTWPLPEQQLTAFNLDVGHGLTAKTPAAGEDSYRVDPALTIFKGPFNNLSRRSDEDLAQRVDAKALAYTGEPLAAETEVTGHPVARLRMRADQPDFNLFVLLEDVEPDGASRFVTNGYMRASHRKLEARSPWKDMGIPYHRSLAREAQPLKPGEAADLVFDLQPTSYIFKAGHRIRFTITGGDPSGQQPEGFDPARPPTLTLVRGASSLVLPVIPASARNAP